MNSSTNKSRSPSPKLNLGRLRQQQQQQQQAPSSSGGRQLAMSSSPSSPGGLPTPSHATPTMLALPTPTSCGGRSPSLRGVVGAARRMSRMPRGSLVRREDCGRQSFRLLASSTGKSLVPLPEDLTHDEYHQVEEHYTRFGPIDSQLMLTSFLTSLGENLSEASLYEYLKKIRQEKRRDEVISSRRELQSVGGVANELISARSRAPSILLPTAGGDDACMSGSSDDEALSTSAWRRGSAATANATSGAANVGSPMQHKKLDALLKKHFLRPFFCLQDVALLLRHVKRGVLTNRSTRDEAKEVFDALCAEGIGAIDAAEFLKVTRNFALQLNVDEVLREIDEDGSGQIELSEFRQLLGRVGATSSAATAHGAVDDDNEVAFDDFAIAGSQPPAVPNAPSGGGPSAVSHGPTTLPPSFEDQAGSSGREFAASDESGAFVAFPETTATASDLQTPQGLPGQRNGGLTQLPSLSTNRLTALLHAQQQQQQQAAVNTTVDALEAQMRVIRREMSSDGVDPLAGIEPQRALASYLALERRGRSPARHRTTRQQTHSMRKPPPAKRRGAPSLGNVKTPSPTPQRAPPGNVRLPPIEKQHVEASSSPAPSIAAVDAPRAVPNRQGGPPHNLHHAPHPSPSGAHRLPPVLLRPGERRQPFHVVEGVFPSWRESYHLYIHPL